IFCKAAAKKGGSLRFGRGTRANALPTCSRKCSQEWYGPFAPHHFPQNCNSASRMAGGAVRFWRPINTFPRNLYGVGMAADTWFEFTLSFPLLSTEVVT